VLQFYNITSLCDPSPQNKLAFGKFKFFANTNLKNPEFCSTKIRINTGFRVYVGSMTPEPKKPPNI
jgi:hypothetical protein